MSDQEPTLEQKREMLAKAGFRGGGFKPAADVTDQAPQDNSQPEEVTDADLAAAQMAADASDANDIAQGLDLNLPGAPAEGEEPPQEGEPAAAPAAPAAAPKGKIRIGTKVFDSQEEAYAYAQEVEAQRIADAAFRQGIETAQRGLQSNTPQETVTPQEPESVPDYYYTDPARYQRELREKIKNEAVATVQQQQAMVERSRQTMTQFYKDYPDLVGDEDVVDMFIKKDWEQIKGLETKVGLKLVADNARNWLEEKVKRRLPAETLPKVTATASRGAPGTVTPKKPDDKPLNFISQQRNLKTPQGRAAAKKRLGL